MYGWGSTFYRLQTEVPGTHLPALGPPSDFEPWTLAECPTPSPFPQKDGEEIKLSKLGKHFKHFLNLWWREGRKGECVCVCVVCVCACVCVCVCSGEGGTNLKVNFVYWNNKLKTNPDLLFALTNNHTNKHCTLFYPLCFLFSEKWILFIEVINWKLIHISFLLLQRVILKSTVLCFLPCITYISIRKINLTLNKQKSKKHTVWLLSKK